MKKTLSDNPDMPLGEIMERWPETIPVFLERGMLCVGCLVNPFHTIDDACLEYDLDQIDFLNELNSVLNA